MSGLVLNVSSVVSCAECLILHLLFCVVVPGSYLSVVDTTGSCPLREAIDFEYSTLMANSVLMNHGLRAISAIFYGRQSHSSGVTMAGTMDSHCCWRGMRWIFMGATVGLTSHFGAIRAMPFVYIMWHS